MTFGISHIVATDMPKRYTSRELIRLAKQYGWTLVSSNNPPAKSGVLVCEPLKAAFGGAHATPTIGYRLKAINQLLKSLIFCFLMPDIRPDHAFIATYRRETKYPLAQKCWPTKLRLRSS